MDAANSAAPKYSAVAPAREGAPPMKPSATPPPVAPIVVAAPRQPNGRIQKSLVRITSTEIEPDYRAPWNTGAIGRERRRRLCHRGPAHHDERACRQ